MIDPAIQKLRKEFSDMMIFHYCYGKPALGVKIRKCDFDIEKNQINAEIVLPGIVQEITIPCNFSTEEAGYHLSGQPELELKRPKVKFYD